MPRDLSRSPPSLLATPRQSPDDQISPAVSHSLVFNSLYCSLRQSPSLSRRILDSQLSRSTTPCRLLKRKPVRRRPFVLLFFVLSFWFQFQKAISWR